MSKPPTPPPAGPTSLDLTSLPLFAPATSAPPGPAAVRGVLAGRTTPPAGSGRGRRNRRLTPPPAAAVTPARPDTTAAAPPPPGGHGGALDWGLVRAFRQQAADQLAAALRDREGVDESDRRELGRSIVLDLLSAHADTELTAGSTDFTAAEQQQLAAAVFDALFGLGRLQPLVDDPGVENIEITGHDRVHLTYSDGRVETGPPVADSDEELVEFLAFLASRSGGSERAFSPSQPQLNLRLATGARLAATAWITPRPVAVIRLHRLVEVTLADLVDRQVMTEPLAAFLRASVRARKTIVVSGAQGSGKTTLVRALANEIDEWEHLGTIETEFELHLHEMPAKHRRVSAWEGRPGAGERDNTGKFAGEIDLDMILANSMRYNLDRVIVGEARGREVSAMLKAMQTAAGSLCTTHSYSARGAIERLVSLAMEAPHVTDQFAYRQVAQHIDLIVQLQDSTARGHRSRYVSEVVALEPGEGNRPAVTDVYRPGVDGRAVPATRPAWFDELIAAGLDPRDFLAGAP